MKELRAPIAVGDSELVFKGPYAHKEVYKQFFRFPDGTEPDFYLWGNINNRPVVVFALTSDHKLILVRQWRPGVNFGKGGFVYELPGGHPKEGQTVPEALRDELREETGYEPEEIVELPEFWLDPPSAGVAVRGFLARDCKKAGERELESTEIMETIEMPIIKWLQMLKAAEPKEKDGKTLAITLLALLRMGWIAFNP